jgi:hypothetical protein
MATTDAQKMVPLDQHTLADMLPEGSRVRPLCACGWRGRPSQSRDEARGQFSTHTARVWEAQRKAAAGVPPSGETEPLDHVEWKRRYVARLMHHGWKERAATKEAEYVWTSLEDADHVPSPERMADEATIAAVVEHFEPPPTSGMSASDDQTNRVAITTPGATS